MTPNAPLPQPLSPRFYTVLSLISLLIAIVLAVTFLVILPEYYGSRASNRLYYIVLFPLGFSAAAFLFGSMKSIANYRRKEFNGVLQLGGPVVLFLIVVIGGFKLVPDDQPFDYTFHLRDPSGRAVIATGKLAITLDSKVEESDIDKEGSCDFKNIPPNFGGAKVLVELRLNGWEFLDSTVVDTIKLNGRSTQLIVQHDKSLSKVFGTIIDNATGRPIPGVQVSLANITKKTDSIGYFLVSIPLDLQKSEQEVMLYHPSYQPRKVTLYPPQRDVTPIHMFK